MAVLHLDTQKELFFQRWSRPVSPSVFSSILLLFRIFPFSSMPLMSPRRKTCQPLPALYRSLISELSPSSSPLPCPELPSFSPSPHLDHHRDFLDVATPENLPASPCALLIPELSPSSSPLPRPELPSFSPSSHRDHPRGFFSDLGFVGTHHPSQR